MLVSYTPHIPHHKHPSKCHTCSIWYISNRAGQLLHQNQESCKLVAQQQKQQSQQYNGASVPQVCTVQHLLTSIVGSELANICHKAKQTQTTYTTYLSDKSSFILPVCSLYLNRPPQCWHWSPTQPGKHTQLPVAVLHCPFIQGLSHSFASVKPGSPESSPITDNRSAVVSISRLRPRPEPEQARRVAPYILSQKMAALRQELRCCGDSDPTSCRLVWFRLSDLRFGVPGGNVQCLR